MADTLTTLRTALSKLEAGDLLCELTVADMLRKLIASMEAQEPVGQWTGSAMEWTFNPFKMKAGAKLYTHPAQPSEPKAEPARSGHPDDAGFEMWWAEYMPDSTQAEAIAAWNSAQPKAIGLPVCPDCHAPDVMYECVWCSATNYPPKPASEPKTEPVQEPFAWVTQSGNLVRENEKKNAELYGWKPLFVAPQARKPLTTAEALAALQTSSDFQGRIALTWVDHENQTVLTDVGKRVVRAIESKIRGDV